MRTGQLVAPYILTAAITFGGFAIAGKTPFIKDDIKKKKETKKELDNFGNIKYEQSYDGFHESNNTISYVSNWTKQENGSYSREIKTYAQYSNHQSDLMITCHCCQSAQKKEDTS